jgi:hypothetical protein
VVWRGRVLADVERDEEEQSEVDANRVVLAPKHRNSASAASISIHSRAPL